MTLGPRDIDPRTDREKLADLLAGLETERDDLVEQIATAPEREHAARVEALMRSAATRSDSKGAASPVRKIRDQTPRDEARLTNIVAELRAVNEAIDIIDAAAEAEIAYAQSRVDAARREPVTLIPVSMNGETVLVPESPNTRPAAAPAGRVVPVSSKDPRWQTLVQPRSAE